MKIFILKPSSLGDVIQALPVLRLLKDHDPSHQIYWWIASELAPLLQDDPQLDGVYAFDRQRWASPFHWGSLVKSIQSIRRQNFDLVIDLQGLARSALFAWLARGHLTLGMDDPREGATAFYDLAISRPSYNTHAVDWYLHVLRRLDVPVHQNFQWLPPRPNTLAAIERKWQPSSRGPWIIFNPGARWLNKRWPAHYFLQLGLNLARLHPHLQIAILGSTADQPLARAIASQLPSQCLDLTGQTSLPEMIEWIRLSQLIITNDTGPMHVAAALGKPLIPIFGPTNPARTGPYQHTHHVLRANLPCIPCMKASCSNPIFMECMTSITPDLVLQKAQQLLQPAVPPLSSA